jgi:hypothetical protein
LYHKKKRKFFPEAGGERDGRRAEVAQAMHTHVSKCKNDKLKERKEIN